MVLSADNSEADLVSDAGFALLNAREGKQWNFRTADGGDAFSATIQGTSGTEFKVTNTTDHFSGVQLHLGNGAKNVGGVWIDASSRALKENIKDLSSQDALAAFHKLQPVTYNYKTDKQEQVVGFIAEDVPELVAIQSRDGLSAMDMVAVLTKVVQEQEKKMTYQDQKMITQEKVLAKTRVEAKAKSQKIATMEARQRAQEEKIAKLESILTNLALDTSNAKKEKVSVNLK
ncbi:tail fiber domain-containing protein [Sulfurovum sp. CS9]|uniref:tail fiber domain-containing protein n=1 Tax=Sulfurovum sp. CS9 TaxID=3391146 RepID=UPI0039E93477